MSPSARSGKRLAQEIRPRRDSRLADRVTEHGQEQCLGRNPARPQAPLGIAREIGGNHVVSLSVHEENRGPVLPLGEELMRRDQSARERDDRPGRHLRRSPVKRAIIAPWLKPARA